MKSKIYLYEVLTLLIWIAVVMLLFKWIPEKQRAALLAGIGFVLWPALFILLELKSRMKNTPYLAALAFFLFANALPIFLLRVLNWGAEFSTLSLFGISGTQLHKASNFLYILMVAAGIYTYVRTRRLENGKNA